MTSSPCFHLSDYMQYGGQQEVNRDQMEKNTDEKEEKDLEELKQIKEDREVKKCVVEVKEEKEDVLNKTVDVATTLTGALGEY